MATTPNLGVELLTAAQGQKHVTVNEALIRLDVLVQARVIEIGLTAPPGGASDGDVYIPGSGATGAWDDWDFNVVYFLDGEWRKVVPQQGWQVFNLDDDTLYRYDTVAFWEPVATTSAAGVSFAPAGGVAATDVQAAIEELDTEKAPKASPAFTGNPTAPTPSLGDNDTSIATTAFVKAAIDVILGGVSSAFDTLSEIVAGFIPNSLLTTRGDIIRRGASAPERLGLGTAGQALKSNGTDAVWAASREVLTGARTYYVRTDGSDSNTGLVDSAGDAFLTIQKAIDTVAALDMSTFQVTIQVGDGTYTGANALKTYIGLLPPIIQGNSGTPANVLISTTSANCFTNDAAPPWRVKDLKVQTTTSGRCLYATAGGAIYFSNLDFGASAIQHILADTFGVIKAEGNYAVSAGAQIHVQGAGGQVLIAGRTITFSNSPNFSNAFAVVNRSGGNIDAFSMTFTNGATVTGKRYDAGLNGTITVAGQPTTYLPGNVAGTTATGGQYA